MKVNLSYYTPHSSSQLAKNVFQAVLQDPDFLARRDDFVVGRAPWPAADPLVGLLGRRKSRTRGPARTRASAPHLVAAMLLCGAANPGCSRLSRRLLFPGQWVSIVLPSGSIREC